MFRHKKPPPTAGDYPCPCCGRLVHVNPPGDYEVCPVCDWEDDPHQIRWPDATDGPNGTASLIDGQQAFQRKAADAEHRGEPIPGGEIPLAPGWRPVDLDVDHFEPCGVEEMPYPDDLTLLYWWRPDFWRRQPGVPG